MTLKLIPVGLLAILIVHLAPKPEGPCSWSCHDVSCPHGLEAGLQLMDRLHMPDKAYATIEWAYVGIIQWLHDMPVTYREANFIVYGVGLPGLALLLALALGVSWPWLLAAVGGSALFALHPDWYDLCTEFCIYMGNWTGLGYVGFNVILFLFLMPGFLLLDLFLAFRKLILQARAYSLAA